jgi:TonB family protein
LTVSAAVLVARLTLAQTPSPNVEEPSTQYRDSMRAMADILLKPGNNRSLVDDANTLKTKLAEVESFWAAKNVDDAVAFAKTGGEAAAQMEEAARASDNAQVASARQNLTATCVGCHQKHVRRTADTSFRIVYQDTAATASRSGVTGIAPRNGTGVEPATGRGISPRVGVTIPKVLSQVKAQYTAEAMRMRAQGAALVTCVVETDGSVSNAQIVRSLDPVFGLDEEALKAARQWRFQPGMRDGEPVRVSVTIEMSFTLR